MILFGQLIQSFLEEAIVTPATVDGNGKMTKLQVQFVMLIQQEYFMR